MILNAKVNRLRWGTDCKSAPAGGADCQTYTQLYWYHPDYLGNTEFVTDAGGYPYQFFYYSAFGETLWQHDANTGTFATPYKFNAKELDVETGNYYYGARYYNPQSSIWFGVDAMAHKGTNITPFAFSHNNPVMLVDPDGNWPLPSLIAFHSWLNGVTVTAPRPGWQVGENSGYTYSREDIQKRNYYLRNHPGGGFARGIRAAEASGNNFQIQDNSEPYINFKSKWDQGYFGMGANAQFISNTVGATGLVLASGILGGEAAIVAADAPIWGSALQMNSGTTAGLNMLSNAAGQFLTNGHKGREIDIVDVGASAFGGWAPQLIASVGNISINNGLDNNSAFTCTTQLGLGFLQNKVTGLKLPNVMTSTQKALFGTYINATSQAIGSGVVEKTKE